MAYQSIFGIKSASTTEDTPQQTQAKRAATKQRQVVDIQRKKKKQQLDTEQKKNNSLLNKVGRVAKSIGTAATTSEKVASEGVVRTLVPGGNADIEAEKRRTEQAGKNTILIKKTVKDKKKQAKLLNMAANNASAGSKSAAKTIDDMPTRKELAAGFAGTAADIASGGTFSAAFKGVKAGKLVKDANKVVRASDDALDAARAAKLASKGRAGRTIQKTKNVATDLAPAMATNAAAGGLNAAAGGGDRDEVVKNAGAGVLFPIALKGVGEATAKATNTIMSKVRAPKKLLEQAKQQKLLEASSAKEAQVSAEKVAKLDQKIELIEAKRKDGKFSNVDQVKVKQLKAERENLAQSRQTYSEAAKSDIPVVRDTANELLDNTTKAADTPVATDVPTIKAYGREIKLSKENGYKTTDTPNGPVYSKVARNGRNNKDSNLSMSYYDANGTKLTSEQAQAAISGKSRAPATEPTKPPTSTKPKIDTPEPGTRTLKPTETSHLPEIGGYTHSSQMAEDYADMLRSQEKSVKGGQLIPDGEGGYKRTSEHSRFYREHYKEHGKPPTKADYLEHAKKELESGKDAMGAGEDYKTLLQREAKPVERVKVESTVKDVPQGTSKVGDTALEAAVGKSLKAKYGEAAQYDKVNIQDQAKKAVAVTGDRAKLERIISGEDPLPDGLRATALIDAIERHPELGKDTDLLVKLSKSKLASESSYSAQELRLARERVEHSPIESMRQLREVREKALEKKTKKTPAKAVSDEVKQIRAATPKVRSKDWESLVDSLRC